MTINNRFWVWAYPIEELWVPAGRSHRRVFIASNYGPGADYYDWPLDYDSFMTGPSDYDMPSDEVYCPCGETLAPWDGTAGELLRMIYRHCAKAGHPKPRFDR